jgi:tetratricopeptide (TPR) repeat protein/plastocyanin
MSPRGVPVTEGEQAQNELLARLGLPATASPEDVDRLHEAASEYLASAPSELRGWAHAQVAALDAAYLQLTDPVGLEGSALRSPTSSSAVVPGGPATPPARRDLPTEEIPAAVAVAALADDDADEDDEDDDADDVAEADDADEDDDAAEADDADAAEAVDGEPDAEDLAALYASVTPSAHADMIPTAKRPTKKQRRDARKAVVTAPAAATPPAAPNAWKRAFIGAVGLVVVGFAVFAVFNLVGGMNANGGTPAASDSAAAQQTAPAIDQAKVADLMTKYAANPKDIGTILALGDEFYFGNQFDTAATWYQKAIEVDPKNETALNAMGAVYYNKQDFASSEKTWLEVVGINPDNVEAHFNLGFLYMNQATPDLAKTQAEWEKVVALDPTSQFAQVAQSHLDSLVKASMIPSAAPGASAAPAVSAAPGASTAPSAAPVGSPAAVTLQQTAQNVAFGTTTLAGPANAPFTIHFANNDTGVQHDIVITEPGGNPVFTGALIDGGTATDYTIPALPAGTYTFKCSLHPVMTGTLTVGS